MNLIRHIKNIIGLRSPLRVAYHWCKGVLAYLLSGNPAKGMYVIGVTGTKGKTTTSTLIARALEEDDKKVCLITTAQMWIGAEKHENTSKMTMDNPFHLWRTLRKAKKAGVTHLVLETSSHGIYYFRNFGIRYNAVMLTNISRDHLDLHGTMEHYVRTKARLFQPKKNKFSLLPRDSEYFDLFLQSAKGGKTFTYSTKTDADYRALKVESREDGMSLTIQENDSQYTLTSKLSGMFNAENLLGAYGLLRSMGMDVSILQKAWRDFAGAPGRMEAVTNDRGIRVLVDYAHTGPSLRSVLTTLREQNSGGRILVVFGATGDRDTARRPQMGAAAHELADVVVLTDDDTYTEPSLQIIEMIKPGIPREIGETFQIIPDRRAAIEWALGQAKSGDTLIIAGKGCETVQVTNSGPIPWVDRGIVEEYFEKLTKK